MRQLSKLIPPLLQLGAIVLILSTTILKMQAQTGTRIVLQSETKAGTILRLQTATTDDVTVEGACKGDFFGEYVKESDDKPIILTGIITQLECYGNQISAIEIVSAPDLLVLNCKDNQISSLDLTSCPTLARLDASQNKLSTITLLKENRLEYLYLQQNQLMQLTIPSSPMLQRLECGYNKLTLLDVSSCPKLQDLYCQKNSLTQLSVASNKMLWGVKLFGNQIQGEAMTKFIETLPQGSASIPMLYVVDTKDISEQNICLMADVDKAYERGWVVYDHFGGAEVNGQIGCPYKGYDYVPQKAEIAFVLTTQRAKGSTIELDITKGGDDDITIEGVAERAPYEGKQTYTTVEQTIVIRGSLSKLDCSGGEISEIQAHQIETLVELACERNLLCSLDLSGALALKTLSCQNNLLKSIDLTDCPNLIRINCWNNLLRARGASNFVATLRDGRTDEPIIFLFDSQLPNHTKDGNIFLKSDISNLKSKGWIVKDYINGDYWGMGKNYEGEDPTYHKVTIVPSEHGTITVHGISNLEEVLFGSLISLIATPDKGYRLSSLTAGGVDITSSKQAEVLGDIVIEATFEKGEEEMPKEFFSFTRAEQGVATFKITTLTPLSDPPLVVGADVMAWKNGQMIIRMTADSVRVYSDITELVIPYSQLTSLDVSHLPHLTDLNCMLNSLKNIDLSASVALRSLSCEMNQLSSLDLAKNRSLSYVNCYGNKISGGQMKQMMTQLPICLLENPGLLILVDSTYPIEGNSAEPEDIQLAISKHWVVKDLNGDPSAMKDYTETTSIVGDGVHIYPNPTSDLLCIDGVTEQTVIVLYSPEANELIHTVAPSEGVLQLSLETFPNGVYYLLVDQVVYPIVVTH